jgi:hypothetical protein
MAGMKSMRRTKSERDAQTKGDGETAASPARPPERDDVEVRLDHHHIEKLGLDGPLPHGTPIRFHGEGEVADSGTTEGYSDGEPRHHMTVRMSRAALEHDAPKGDETRGDIRAELAKNTDASEAKRADRDASRSAAKGGAKEPEKVGG